MLQGDRAGAKVPSAVTGAWSRREDHAGEAAVQLDKLSAVVARLERDVDRSCRTVNLMADEAARAHRVQSFEDTLKHSREYKIADLQRTCRELKQRLDGMEGDRSAFPRLTYRSFAAVDRRFAEINLLDLRIAEMEAVARRNAAFGYAALAVAAVSLVAQFIF